MNLDEQYEVTANEEKVMQLAEKIWDSINEVNPDPMHPNFNHFEDPVKDEIVAFSSRAVLGFPAE